MLFCKSGLIGPWVLWSSCRILPPFEAHIWTGVGSWPWLRAKGPLLNCVELLAMVAWMASWVPIGSFLVTALISFIIIGLFRFSVSWFSLGGLYISRSLFIWHSLFSKGLWPAILSFSVFQGAPDPGLFCPVRWLTYIADLFTLFFLLSVYMTAWDLSKHERLAELVVCFIYIIQSMSWGPSLLALLELAVTGEAQ